MKRKMTEERRDRMELELLLENNEYLIYHNNQHKFYSTERSSHDSKMQLIMLNNKHNIYRLIVNAVNCAHLLEINRLALDL